MNKNITQLFFKLLGLILFAFLVAGCGSSDKDPEPLYSLFPTGTPVQLSESEKMSQLDFTTRPYAYEFSSAVTLYASTAPGRPSRHPSDPLVFVDPDPLQDLLVFIEPEPVYSNGYKAAFVEEGKDEDLWFAYTVHNASADRIIWQVSDRPFSVDRKEWTDFPGLLQTGQVSAVDGEFVIDMGQLSPVRFSLISNPLVDGFVDQISDRLAPQQSVIYVRAFALDNSGEVIGDLDRGLAILYGHRLTYEPPVAAISIPFELLTAVRKGELYGGGEFQNTLGEAIERSYNSEQIVLPWYFRPQGFPQQTDTIYLQVSTHPLGVAHDDWRDPSGLVHEIKLTRGMPEFDNLTDDRHAIAINFPQFATVPSEYYVRAVALSAGSVAGTVREVYSKTVKIVCGITGESEFIYYPEPVEIAPVLPDFRLLQYNRIRWESSNWMYRYEVVRQPTYKEYMVGASFSNELIPGLLPGTIITLEKPSSNDGSWISSVWNSVTGFFSSIVDYLASVTNWISTAYADAKAGLIEFVANNLPLLPDEFRDELQDALTYAVDYGLASVGIPPELPNFDQLSEMGVDYIASTAMQTAGVPDNKYTTDMVKELGNGIKQNLSSSARTGNAPNPFNWNFVRQDPSALYRPAYLLMEFSNSSNETTPAGILFSDVVRDVSDDELMDGNIATLVATFGGTHHFELFRPVHDVVVPRLLPGQSIIVPIYYQEYTGVAYPFNSHVVTQNDFLAMHNYLDHFTFNIRVKFNLSSAQQYAISHGFPTGSGESYVYKDYTRGASYTRDPAINYYP
jgi:hypothetical protein